MSEQVNLREASDSDGQEIASLFRLTRRENLPYLPELHSSEEDLEYFKKIIEDQSVIVSQIGEEVVGFCAYKDNWLNHLYIIPKHQHRGIGKSLLDQAKADNNKLNLWVFQRNTNAIDFYEKNGFELLELTDGLNNEENEPDAHYVWQNPGKN
jgi:putative acetyltransferase